MTIVEILKQTGRVVADLIKERTPPVFETCRQAYKLLGEIVHHASKSHDDELGKEFAGAIDEVIKSLEAFRAPLPAAGVAKEMKVEELAAYLKTQVEKALVEDAPRALTRLHALKAAIAKVSWAGGETATIEEFTDPWQQASLEIGVDGKKVTSGAAQVAEVTVPGLAVADLMKAMVTSVAKAEKEALTLDTGWPLDLTTPEFLQGGRGRFGRDSDKS
jgi:hypothetical protein